MSKNMRVSKITPEAGKFEGSGRVKAPSGRAPASDAELAETMDASDLNPRKSVESASSV
ncbi:MAG: hypothetical protein LBD35_04605 [Prevotellaceae bacterium]|nr:hypothetical protein [Prevotellaceae bacterium]